MISRALAHRHLVAQEALTLESVDVQDNQVTETRMVSLSSSLGNVRECLLCICNCKIAWDVEERNLQKWLGHQAVPDVVVLGLAAVVQAQAPVQVGAVHKSQENLQDNLKTSQDLSKQMKIHASPQQVTYIYSRPSIYSSIEELLQEKPQDNQKKVMILDSAWFVLSYNKNTSRFAIYVILVAA